MASQVEPAWNGPRSGNPELRSSQGPANQEGEEVAELSFPSPGLTLLNNRGHGHGRLKIWGLYQSFCSWLQPERNSKQEMIVSLVLEQFLRDRPHRERAAWQKKWEASGRDLDSFMEDLDDEDLSPPGLVHVQMQGQEALFSENTPLAQVVAYFTEQHSAAAPTALTPGTPSWTPTDTSEPTAPGDAGEHGNSPSSEDHQPTFLLILQAESCPGPAEGAVTRESPHSPRASSPGASTAQEEPPREETREETQEAPLEETQEAPLEETQEAPLMETQEAPLMETQEAPLMETQEAPLMETQEAPLMETQEAPLMETQEAAREETQEAPREETREAAGAGSARKLYTCDLCPRVFQFLSRFQLHQRRHNNERPCVCPTCGKAFFQASDLRVHQRIHVRDRPFRCGRCNRAFSHRTNLRAHERIHTGDKPYACAQCGRTYRQSSTYHRHLRMHQRKDSTSGDSVPGPSTSGASTSGASTSGDSTSGDSTPRDTTTGASSL